MYRKPLFIAVAVAALAAPAAQADPDSRFHSPPVAETLKAARLAAARADYQEKIGDITTAAVTKEEVGDADSFGRNVKWLGLVAGSIQLDTDCTPPPDSPPNPNCVTVAAAPGFTPFSVPDIASITLPARSSRTLLCHWQTPIVSYFANNSTGASQSLQLTARPTYRIESEVLDEPGLVDPNTGLPYNGVIETSLSAINQSRTLGDGEFESELITGARMCIASIISRDALIGVYGLTPNQATRFFRRPITITMGITGSSRMVEGASIYFGTRFVGD